MHTTFVLFLFLLNYLGVCWAVEPSFWDGIANLARLMGNEELAHHYETKKERFSVDLTHHPVFTHPVSEDTSDQSVHDLLTQVYFSKSHHREASQGVTLDQQQYLIEAKAGLLSRERVDQQLNVNAQSPDIIDVDDYAPYSLREQAGTSTFSDKAFTPFLRPLRRPPAVMTAEQRLEILQRVGQAFNRIKSPEEISLICPYAGDKLTKGLMSEAFKTKFTKLRLFDEHSKIFLVRSEATTALPIATQKDGKMPTQRPRNYHLYVWQQIVLPRHRGSIFRLIGLVESAILTKHKMGRFPLYTVTNPKLRAVGKDSLYIHKPLMEA